MLVSIENIADDVLLGLWKMEDEPSLKVREKERKAVRELVAAMLNSDDSFGGQTKADYVEIGHEESGKPLLDCWHISISHTRGYVAVMLSKTREVGVDIEYVSERIKRIADRFLRADEHAESVNELLIHWCAKETIYKLYSEQDLTFQQMKVVDLKYGTSSQTRDCERLSFHVESASSDGVGASIEVFYRINADYVLTFAYSEEKQIDIK